jgi:hypothetical protein
MKPSEQRKKLHSYIADLDDKKVLAMLTLLEDEVKYKTKPAYSENEKEEIRSREKNRTNGKSKTYSLTEARKLFRSKKSK